MADLNLDLSGIKPLLGQLGLGQAPASSAPPVDKLPVPPMPAPLTPPQAGYTAWSADPTHQQTIANSLTMPGTPITPPNVPPASPLSSAPVPPPTSPFQPYNPMSQYKPLAGPQPLQAAQLISSAQPNTPAQPISMAQDMAANPDQYQKPMLKKAGILGNLLNFGAAGLIGAGGGLKGNPSAGADWVNQQAANDRAIPAANAAQYDLRNIKPLKDAAALADVQSQTAQRNAAADLAGTKSDDFSAKTLTKEQAAAINQPDLAGTAMTGRDYAKLVASAGNNNTSTGNNTRNNTTKSDVADANNASKESIAAQRAATQKLMSDATNKTKTLIAQMHDSTSRANNENTNSTKVGGGPAAGGGFKVPADVTKRAALGANVLENADAVDQIINKRPDIIGAAGGRYSNVQQMIGSDDPDIQALGVRMHNIALASNGAHGVRAQQAIQKTEDELFGNFKAGPNAIKGALGATRASMQTFLNDEQNFSTTGKRTGGTVPTSTTLPEGTVKTNSHGDKVKISGGKWGPA